jgi:carbonic anhydrase/acetyltransferase-like protein (isoleucine patch superfamily)
MVGNGAIVLHRSVVGHGAVVAANSVVLYDVDIPPGALAVGSPATIKEGRARADEIQRSVDTYVRRAQRFASDLRRIG